MVKRAKSPDLPDDAKYLVVHQPYPLNANFELPGDYIAFAFWAATVIGRTTEVWGIHHKPKVGSWSGCYLISFPKVRFRFELHACLLTATTMSSDAGTGMRSKRLM
jgi:hypothetical protein